MRSFFELASPGRMYIGEAVYGKASWERRYPRAEWSDVVDSEQIVCPVNPGHRRGGERLGNLTVILGSPRIGDFVWPWLSECLTTERVCAQFEEAGLTGFEAKPVTIERVKRVRRGQPVEIPALWELAVTGKGGNAHPDSGIRMVYRCEACGMVRYSSYRNGILVDEREWDGSDFFTVTGYPKHILVTERVKDWVVKHQLTNCALMPSHTLRWPQSLRRPEEIDPG